MNYAEEAAKTGGKPARGNGHLCCARGCPLPGTTTSSTSGTQEWYCRVHFGLPASRHDGVTVRINNRLGLYQIAAPLSNEPPRTSIPKKTRDQVRALGKGDILRQGVHSANDLAALLYGVLDAECRDPQSHMDVPASAGATTWLTETENM